MDRNEIVDKLREYIKDGKLLSKAQNGAYYHGFDRGIDKRELFATPYDSVVATDSEVANWFLSLIDTKRVMNKQMVRCVHRDLTSKYLIEKACMRGELIKFNEFGKGCVLYIE